MNESLCARDSIGPADDLNMIEDEETFSGEELDEEEARDHGRGILYLVFAAVITGFFLWLLLGLWGFLQEMSYGHG